MFEQEMIRLMEEQNAKLGKIILLLTSIDWSCKPSNRDGHKSSEPAYPAQEPRRSTYGSATTYSAEVLQLATTLKCEKCGGPMVPRTRKNREGDPFFGCGAYPRCEGTIVSLATARESAGPAASPSPSPPRPPPAPAPRNDFADDDSVPF